MIVAESKIDLIEVVHRFVKALEENHNAEILDQFYHLEIEQMEYPNLLTQKLVTRHLPDLKDSFNKGQKVISKHQYEIINTHVTGNTVILETIWTGTVAIPLGKLPVGGEMKAYFAQVYEFKNGKIIRQRNYDCFEPFN